MTPVTRRPAHSMQRTPRRQWARGAAAALVLVALLVGAPLALALLIGDPLPQHLPSGGQVHRGLIEPLADSQVVKILALVAWLAWAHLLVSVVRELLAQLRGLPSPRRLPVLGFNQAFAHRLVATALLLIPAAGSLHATPVSALTRATGAPPAGSVAAVAALTPSAATMPAPKVAAAAAANGHAVLPMPTLLTAAPHQERPAHKVYVVEPPHGRHYDSLWDIAARHLGDGRRYHEIYELNRGRPQPDGGELTKASLIQPGWVLLLPADATGPGVHDADHAHATTPKEPTKPATTTEHTDPTATELRAAATHNGNVVALPTRPLAPQAEPTTRAGNSDSPAPPARTPAHHTAPERGVPITPIGLGLGLGSLAALAALQRARRIAQRRRPLGQRPAPVPEQLRAVEAGLRAEARRVDPLAATVRLAVALAAHRGVEARLVGVLRHDDGRVELLLTDPAAAPTPFTATDRGWQLAPHAAGFTFAVDEQSDPLPALLQLGRGVDSDLYLDIERGGCTTVDGEPDLVDDLLATAAARLVGAPWAGLAHVMIPTRLAPKVGPLEHVEAVDELTARGEELLRYASTVRDQLRNTGHDTVAAARRAGPADSVALLTLIGWRTDELPEQILLAALDPAVPLLLLASGSDPRAQQWHLDGEQLTGTAIGEPIAVPSRVPETDLVAALIEHAHDAPAVPADDPAYEELRQDAPPTAAAVADNTMSIDLLGPVELRGIETPRRTPALQTLVYLALHRRGVTAEQLSTALWPDEVAAGKTVRNRVAEARAVVAGGISDGPGWKLADTVGCDWQQFQALAAGTTEQKIAALSLVRGQPFDGYPDEWVDVEMFRTDMVAAVIDLAAEVAERALTDEDPALAFRAARAGLRASPYEERLFRLAMLAADAEGSTGKLRALMNELHRVLDVQIEPDDRMQDETIALYEELTSAMRRRQRA